MCCSCLIMSKPWSSWTCTQSCHYRLSFLCTPKLISQFLAFHIFVFLFFICFGYFFPKDVYMHFLTSCIPENVFVWRLSRTWHFMSRNCPLAFSTTVILPQWSYQGAQCQGEFCFFLYTHLKLYNFSFICGIMKFKNHLFI